MGGQLGAFTGQELCGSEGVGGLDFSSLDRCENSYPSQTNAISCSLEEYKIAPSGVTRGFKTVAKGSLGKKCSFGVLKTMEKRSQGGEADCAERLNNLKR